MAEEKKIARLADVGELEADLKKDLAEEEAKGKAADILFCESIEDELSDLSNLPTMMAMENAASVFLPTGTSEEAAG